MTSVVRVGPRSASGCPVVLLDDSGERLLRHADPAGLSALTGDPSPRGRRSLGRALHDLVHDPSLAGAVYLDVRDEELRSLPWELVIGPDGRRPFLAEGACWARGAPRPCARGEVLVPIRLLVVLGDTDDPALLAREEADAIRRSLRGRHGAWHVEVLDQPTPRQFFDRMDEVRPHVLHFVGHSGVHPLEGLPMLAFNGPAGAEGVTADRILNSVKEPPRLVVLNACGAEDPSELAAAFGAGAVITMRGDVTSGPAVVFAEHFYDTLASGAGVGEAVRAARSVMFREGLPEWEAPSLVVWHPVEQVLPWRFGVDDATARHLGELYSGVAMAVDRTTERWTLWGGPDSDAPPHRAMLVDGGPGVGKSSLVRSCVFTWRLRGCAAVYVDAAGLRDGRNVPWLDVVRALAAALPPLPGAARFAHQLVHLRRGSRPPAGPFDPDDLGPWEAANEAEPHLREALFEGLRALLAEAGPVTIVLDHLALVPELTDTLVPGLLLPVLDERPAGVSVIVAADDDRVLGGFAARAHRLRVEPWHRDRTEEIFREFGARANRPFKGGWKDASDWAREHAPVFMPSQLHTFHRMIETGRP
ncbi:CHAT domain-containing protein [Herbidospora sp. NEAU-GS84]|uniref:CHAT domain-containing protein n=1 Tax=Herbidospora solisilvae TaxID=2696284 RepID=A0A7C9NEU7_9ACTN|nr:CHAT domain-containing protein [Herbidospora solisilvae]NAS21158.1 CHAT domain-containing protein [Herbidospora solisilvae]